MKIALVTDTHLTPADENLTQNWLAADEWLELEKTDCLIHLGDITANGIHDPNEFIHARQLIEKSHDNVRYLPGNHDIGDNSLQYGATADEKFSSERLEQFRAVFGPDWWHFVADDWLVAGLNTQLFGTDTHQEEKQYEWLAGTLASHTGPVGLMLHKPLVPVSSQTEQHNARYLPLASRNRLLSLITSVDVRFIASGHTHQMYHEIKSGIEYFWIPSTSFCFPDNLQHPIGDKFVGVAKLTLEENHHQFSICVPNGMQNYSVVEFSNIYPQVLDLQKTSRKSAEC